MKNVYGPIYVPVYNNIMSCNNHNEQPLVLASSVIRKHMVKPIFRNTVTIFSMYMRFN